MISALEGTIVNRGTNSVVLKAGPVSLVLNVPGSTLSRMGPIGSEIMLHTHLYVREDNISLYGFFSHHELLLFEQLINVSGIGPKVALSLLSNLNTEQLISAIVSGNADLLSQVPGIGKKTAGRIILELKSKLEKGWEGEIMPAIGQADADVVAALTGLGYSIKEATQAVSNVSQAEGMPLEDKVRQALQKLAKK